MTEYCYHILSVALTMYLEIHDKIQTTINNIIGPELLLIITRYSTGTNILHESDNLAHHCSKADTLVIDPPDKKKQDLKLIIREMV